MASLSKIQPLTIDGEQHGWQFMCVSYSLSVTHVTHILQDLGP